MKALLLTGYVDTIHEVAGIMEHLHTYHAYDFYIGSATASILVALAAIDDFDTILSLLTKLKSSESLISRIFRKKMTLKDYVRQSYTVDKHHKVIIKNIPIFIPLLNLNNGVVEFMNISLLTYPDAIAAIMVSVDTPCEAVPFKIDDDYYITASIIENLGFQHAIEQEGVNHIDIVIPRKKEGMSTWKPGDTPTLERVFSLINSMLQEKGTYEIAIISEARDIATSIYFLDSEVVEIT